MLWPSLVMSTSPGLIAASPGMFSVIGAIAVTLAPTPSAAAAPRAPRTMAAPDMSVFMVVMPSAVLRRQPARVEGDALAHEHDVGPGSRCVGRHVVGAHQPGGCTERAPRRAGPRGARHDPLLVPHLDGHARLPIEKLGSPRRRAGAG